MDPLSLGISRMHQKLAVCQGYALPVQTPQYVSLSKGRRELLPTLRHGQELLPSHRCGAYVAFMAIIQQLG